MLTSFRPSVAGGVKWAFRMSEDLRKSELYFVTGEWDLGDCPSQPEGTHTREGTHRC